MLVVVAVAAVGAWLFLRPREAAAAQQWVSLPGVPEPAPGALQLPEPAPVPTAEGPTWTEQAGTWFRELITPDIVETPYRSRLQWRTLLTPELRRWENEYGLPSGFLEAIAERESGFRDAVITCQVLGGVGEKGLMQIWPKYHPDKGCNPVWSIQYAAGFFREHYDRYNSWPLAIMAWNWGSGNMDEFGTSNAPALTREYIAQIGRQVDLA